MANETIMQGLLDSLMRRPQDETQQKGVMLANLMSQPNPLAAGAAFLLPQQLANVGMATQGLFGLKAPVSPAQKLQEMITANPTLQNSSAGLTQLARAAEAAGDRATALRFSAEAARLAQLETVAAQEAAQQRQKTTTAQMQIGTTLQYLSDVLKSTDNAQAKAEIGALMAPAASGAQTSEQIVSQVNKVLDRYKITPTAQEPSKAKVTDYEVPGNGATLSLRTDEQGLVFYQGAWQDPGTLGLRQAATRTTAKTATTEEVDPVAARSLMGWANVMGYLPQDPNDPIFTSYADAVNSGVIKTQEVAKNWLEKMPNTPAFNQQQATIKNNTLAAVAPSLRNIQDVNAILLDPNSNVGDKFSYIEDYALNTGAARLKAAIAPIVSDAALRQIQTLKQQASALGGEGTGLGAIAVAEFEALQNSIENLKTVRTKADLTKAVADYELHLMNIRNANSGRPLILVEGDPAYSGLPFEAGNAPGEIFINLNGTKVPVTLHESVDDALARNRTR